jgi:hypothetical protein
VGERGFERAAVRVTVTPVPAVPSPDPIVKAYRPQTLVARSFAVTDSNPHPWSGTRADGAGAAPSACSAATSTSSASPGGAMRKRV